MVKFNKINIIIIAFLLIATMFSCKKYEEGPRFSLSTKKTRISNKWAFQSVRYLETGVIKYSDFDKWHDFYDKEYDFTRTIIYLNETTTYQGKWQFTKRKKGIQITYSRDGLIVTEVYKIVRLTQDEFWIRDNEKEIHYMTFKR